MPIVKPIAKVLYVCDEAVRDPQTGKMSLHGLWDAVRVAEGGLFPYRLGKICVFAWFRDGLGSVNTRVFVVQASTEVVIRQTNEFTLTFAKRTASVFAKYNVNNCLFPAPGDYYVELYCEGEFVDDQVIQVLP